MQAIIAYLAYCTIKPYILSPIHPQLISSVSSELTVVYPMF
eukprot:COSAG05_NODE_1887_length_3886_cov_6.005545_3_plen_41_part_00